MKPLGPVLLALYTFVGVFLGVRAQASWHDVVALGPIGAVVFALGYCVDLLLFGALWRGSVRAWRRRAQ